MSNPKPKPKRRYKRYSSEFKREALLRASEIKRLRAELSAA